MKLFGLLRVLVLIGSNSFAAASYDFLQRHLLKACTDALSLPLYLLFIKCLGEGGLPSL